MLTRSGHDLSDDATQPDQVAHSFVISVRHPDRRQFSGAIKAGQQGGITAVCFHPSPGFIGISDGATTSQR